MHAKDGNSSNHNNTAASSSRVPLDDAMPSTSDFVKKLYKMLEDQSFQPVVSWGPQGDCFVVKDMNEFTKSILPRMFKHSNFASFVRQLNKYDFHKVKNTDDMMQFGEQSWTFRHPDFHADRREALENIKRKVPAQRKQSDLHSQVTSLQSQLRTQEARERELEERVRRLERGQGDVLQGLVGVQRGMAMQDGVVRGLVGGWVGIDGTETKSQNSGLGLDMNLDPGGGLGNQPSTLPPSTGLANPNPSPSLTASSSRTTGAPQNQRYAPFLPTPNGSRGAGEGVGNPEEVARASLVRVGEFSRQQQKRPRRRDEEAREEEEEEVVMPTLGMAITAGAGAGEEHEGLQVYTVGHLMPRTPDPATSASSKSQSSQPSSSEAESHSQKLRVRRSTFVPGWAVPPRVLLVDDDVVSRKLGSKFLQVFGCTIDVAVDGSAAVDKMNLAKYDLVLMDIVMPKLDGVSATSLIRQFDRNTPIISMTSNSKPNQILAYYESGMNDILPKPFSKQGLLDMLEARFPHPPWGALVPLPVPSPGPFGFDVEEDGRINPLAGMGLTDEQYNTILQNIVNGEGFMGGVEGSGGREKRMLEVGEGEEEGSGREGKRSRFEVVE
ncbi:HSF-type DNA-binding-domain-containing protein [Lyophyllum atratum]|nr:HSF-type DNA-binding-domain-containing protein [Lyophyllum atratum]